MRSLKITALTGYLSASQWATQAADCDAGRAAVDLCKVAVHCDVQTLPLPIALENAQGVIDDFNLPISLPLWADAAAANPNEREVRPGIALVGVGVLTGGHRLVIPNVAAVAPETRAIANQLTQLVQLIQQHYAGANPPRPCPVCDLTNRLYFLPPIYRNPTGPPDVETQIQQLVQQIDPFLVTITAQHFHRFRRILIVAGGQEKANAIRYVLQDNQFGFADRTILCTDGECAAALP